MSQDNFVQLEVLGARIDRLEQENSQLSGRIAQLEDDKQALLDVVTSLAALAPGGAELLTGAAALAGGIMSQTQQRAADPRHGDRGTARAGAPLGRMRHPRKLGCDAGRPGGERNLGRRSKPAL